jgi:hypothetical protein
MAIKRTTSGPVEQAGTVPPPPIPTLPGITQKIANPPNVGYPVEYVYVTKGKELRRFPKTYWEKLPADKMGYKELAAVPPEVLALAETKSS